MNLLLYCLRLFVIALACGCWLASFRRVLTSFGAGNRFLAGFCGSVLLLPLFDYLLALIWPGIPGWMLMALPPACAAGYLIFKRPGRGAGDAARRCNACGGIGMCLRALGRRGQGFASA